MKTRKTLISLIGISLALVGCNKEDKITDPAQAEKVVINNEAAEVIFNGVEDASKQKLDEINASNLFGFTLNLGAEANAKVNLTKVDTKVLTVEAKATANAKIQANVDLEGLKKVDLDKGTHADISKTEAYGEINANVEAKAPKELTGEEQDTNENLGLALKAGLKDSKVVASAKTTLQEEENWADVDLSEETSTIDEVAFAVINALNALDTAENEVAEEIAPYVEMVDELLKAWNDFNDDKATTTQFVTNVDTILEGVITASGIDRNLIEGVLNQYKGLDLDKLVSYTSQGNDDIGYIITASFNYAELKTMVENFFTGLEADTKLADYKDTFTAIHSMVTGFLPENITANVTVGIGKDKMVNKLDVELGVKGSLNAESLAMIDPEMVAEYTKLDYELNAKFDFGYTLQTSKVDVTALAMPQEN